MSDVKEPVNDYETDLGDDAGLQDKFSGFKPPDDLKEYRQKPDASEDDADEATITEPPKKIERKKGFTATQIEERRKAQDAAKDLEQQVGKYKETETTLTTEIDSLKAQLQEARTVRQENKISEEIKRVEIERDQIRENLEGEIERRDNTIAFFDLTKSSKFQTDYIAPTIDAYKQVQGYIAGSSEGRAGLNRVVQLNQALLVAENQEDKSAAEQALDEAISDLVEGMPTYKQTKASAYFNEFLRASSKQAEALKNWQVIKEKTQRESEQERLMSAASQKKFWNSLYDDSEKLALEGIATEYDTEFDKIIKDSKIEFDEDTDSAIARAVLSPDSNIKQSEVTRIIAQGRMHTKVKARLSAAVLKIKDMEKLLSKYRDSDPGSSGHGEHRSSSKSDNPLESKLNGFRPR